MAVIVQKLRKTFDLNIQKAVKYYSILSVLNDLDLTRKQVEVLAFTSVRGTITPLPARQEFVTMFDSSLASLQNTKGQLAKLGWLLEVNKMYRVNPKVNLDFSKSIILQINLEDGVEK